MLWLRRFDYMRRAPRSISEGRLSGTITSLVTVILMLCFVYSQIAAWVTPTYSRRTYVSRNTDNYILTKASIIFLSAPCAKIQFHIHDSFVVDTKDHTGHIFKNTHGNGCKLDVDFWLRKNNGEFQFTSTDDSTDMSHIIEDMKFGEEHPFAAQSNSFDALKGVKLRNIGSTTHDYIVKLLDTRVTDGKGGSPTDMYQYTFSHRQHIVKKSPPKKTDAPKEAPKEAPKDGKAVPASPPAPPVTPKNHFIRFKYNWSPLTVDYKVKYQSFYKVVTNSMAFCGGILTTASVLYRAYLGGSAIVKETISKKL